MKSPKYTIQIYLKCDSVEKSLQKSKLLSKKEKIANIRFDRDMVIVEVERE